MIPNHHFLIRLPAWPLRLITALLLCLLSSAGAPARAADFVWLEGETPTSINVKATMAGWGHKEFLSGEKWLQVSIDADKVEKETPADGVLIDYDFAIGATADYEVWNRIGYEFVRSPFQWRIDDEVWSDVSPEELTIDLMELQNWNEVAWLKMGSRKLTSGPHRLQIRLPRTRDEKGNTAHILYASDALCLHAGPFYPNSKYRPDETGRDERDEQAAKQTFRLPEPAAVESRASVPLNGLWEACRADEQMPGEVAQPIRDFPQQPHWKAIQVPGDKMQIPELVMAHRLWYRTRVEVPADLMGRSFHIVFPQNNLNTTVYVNGRYCGFNKNPYARFEIDVTEGIRPGVNEIQVGIKDAYYGYSADPARPMKLRKVFNLPLDWTHQGFQDLAYPIWGAFQSGILNTPEFVAAGPVYASDVYCKPSVAHKELAVEVTLDNRSSNAASGELACQAVDAQTGAVEKQLASQPFSLPAGGEKTIHAASAWDNPKLWWPDAPHMYRLRAVVKLAGKTIDVSETSFGFREWTIDGTQFKLNGVPFHGWCEDVPGEDKDGWLANYRKMHQQMMRFWGTNWFDLTPDQALDYFDTRGVVVRRQDMLDGEAIGYNAIENDPVLKQLYHSDIKMDLMNNWRDQVLAEVKGERNHPAIMIWSIENEWLYINCINLYGNLMDQFEAAVTQVSDAVRATDPTRPTMVDGGAATLKQTLPVHGNHYITGPLQSYPALAYEANASGGGRGRWVWDQKRPRFVGEDYFEAGNHPELAAIGGESAFQGKAGTWHAAGIMARMLDEGYRWAGYGAWDLYIGPGDTDHSQYNAYSQRAVFCRQWDWTFASGQKVQRTFGIFNDTHDDAPITFAWSLRVNGKQAAGDTSAHHVAPGGNEKFDVSIPLPETPVRQEGTLTLSLSVKGAEVYHDVKDVSILNTRPQHPEADALGRLTPHSLCVYDPSGGASTFLKRIGIAFTPLSDLNNLPASCRVMIIGRDALSATDSASSRLAAYAAAGRAVIVLEQKIPLRYQGIPAAMETAQNEGRAAFAEDLDHPVLHGLQQKDLFVWGPDEIVYRNAYLKPTRGGRSLIECDNLLQNTALVEVPAGSGLLLLSQLVLEEKLADNATAQRLLINLIAYGAQYRVTSRPVALAAQSGSQLSKASDLIGLNYAKATDALQTIQTPGSRIAVIDATPASLQALAGDPARVDAFLRAGGWILFNGLTPDGLASYNKIVGFDHMIRPFRREKVTFPAVRSPLTAGINANDIVMYSSQPIFNYQAGNYVVSDEFSYVVDYDEVAPFGKSTFFAYDNITNNFVTADGWPLIINFPVPEDGKPFDIPITFPKPQTITGFTWVGNTLYYPQTRVNLIFDGKDKVSFNTSPSSDPQSFQVDPPRTGSEITLQVAAWTALPNVTPDIGIDNIYLKAQRPSDFYQRVKPLLNIGGMMEYPRGPGGIVLCNLLFKENEEVPENAVKKRNILAALLRNLKAPFSSGKSIIAGADLAYQAIDLSKQANQFRDDRGWFGDKAFTFRDLPTGKHTFAGVPFQIYDFPTSPVPSLIMLGGEGVPGSLPDAVRSIPVGRKADALFFLQTARIDQRRSEQEITEHKPYEMLRYIVHYTDGQQAAIPVYAEIDVDDYKQQTPTALPGAQIGWVKPFPGTNLSAVAYVKQWNNPRPGAEISSIDMEYGNDRRGVPALLAITAASAGR